MEYHVVTVKTLVLCFLLGSCLTEKLSLNQKAPPFARGSGGLSLPVPPEGGNKASSTGNDEVQREETASLKLVGDQLVRTVEGRYSYKSPEGLPIAVKYTADENGTRASFSFGTDPGKKPSLTQFPGTSQTGDGRPTDQNSGNAYLPPQPQQEVNKGYLPPQ